MNATDNKELASYQQHIQEMLTVLTQKVGIPGVCLEVAANGVRVSAAVGNLAVDSPLMMHRQAKFEIGSISKVLLSLVTLELVSRGKLSLDSSLATLLPELNGTQVGEQVLLWHLLSHSTGYKSVNFADADVRNNYSFERLLEFLRGTTFPFKPGTVFSYTVTAPALIAEIIRRATGMDALEVVRTRLLDVLGLSVGNRSADDNQPEVRVAAHSFDPRTRKFSRMISHPLSDLWLPAFSNFTMSIQDLATFAESIARARDGKGSETAFLNDKTATFAQKQTVKVPFTSGGKRADRLPISVGLGSAEFLPDWFGYNGPFTGQSTSFRYHATHKIALAIGMNAHAASLCAVVIHEVLTSLIGDVKLPEPEIEPNELTASELCGVYVGAIDRAASVSQQGDDVVCELGDTTDAQKLRVLCGQDEYKRWIVKTDPGSSPLGFFRDPTTGTPCLMLGPSAYKKAHH